MKQKKAIVIGASVAGLLAARVLADAYEQVVIIERDDLEIENQPRRGVPHGRHAHALLAGGQQVVESLFPGICNELLATGAVAADPANDGTWFIEGAGLAKTSSGTSGVLASRPFIESAIRERVRLMDRIEVVSGQAVRGLIWNDDRSRVIGVRTEAGRIEADLVVDATGRGSRAGAWLETNGYQAPREERVEIQLVYTTRLFKARPDRLADEKFFVVAPTPDSKRGGVIGIQENDTWIVTLFGHFGHVAPDDLVGFKRYAASLSSPAIYNAIRDAEPVGDPVSFRFPASTRRHYEELDRFPDGLLVFGDAICSFNPIYGQGMSVAALQAKTLQETLRLRDEKLARTFFKRASKVIDNPWNIAVGGDLKMPEAIGPRNAGANIINWYVGNVHKQAHTDAVASLAFNRVAQLLAPPTSLMRPAMIVRVLGGLLRRKLRRDSKHHESLLTTAEPMRRVSSDAF